MTLKPADLCATFSERAEWTSGIIGSGYSTRLGILEETVTDINLVEIGFRHPNHVVTKKFSRKEEGSSSGADWLWCIGEPGSWFCLLVQAKIVNPQTGNCHYLDYKSGDQRAKLLGYARRNRLLPRYCIYSYIPPSFNAPLRADPSFSSTDSAQWGCALLTPQRVKRLVARKQKSQSEVLSQALPWNHLFCTGEALGDDRLGPYVANSVAEAESRLETGRPTVERALEEPNPDRKRRRQQVDPRELIREELPRVAQRLLRGTLAPAESPVAAVSVVSSIPIRGVLDGYKALPAPDRVDYVNDWETKGREAFLVRRSDD